MKMRSILFYDCSPVCIEDIEHPLFTKEDKEEFQFFLFHNRDLHFSKEVIKQQTLLNNFQYITPEFDFGVDSVTLTKKIVNFNKSNFEKDVEKRYTEYINRINYRISCIIQTFTIFNDLYQNKDLIFVLPIEIKQYFLDYLQEESFSKKQKSIDAPNMKKYDIFYWINYYLREDSAHLDVCKIQKDEISDFLIVSK